MKKLFLQDGKLMVGEFPEEPTSWGQEDSQYYGCVRDEYHKAVEAAKASAVEVVNPEEITASLAEGHLYDIMKGWTVEKYRQDETGPGDDQYERQVARLIPLKEQSSGIAAVGVAEYGDLHDGLPKNT